MTKRMTRSLLTVSGLLFWLVVSLTFFHLWTFDRAWYDRQFNELGVYQSVPVNEALARRDNLFLYLRGRADLAHPYTERERQHLEDIRRLVAGARLAWVGGGVLLAATFLVLRRGVAWPVILAWWSAVAGGVLVLLALVFGLWFDTAYVWLHMMLFRNDFWMLDPAREALIQVFPVQLFQRLILRILVWTAGALAVCAGLAGMKQLPSFRKPGPRV